MKKLLFLTVAITMMFASLAGCNDKETSAKQSKSGTKMDVKWEDFVKHYNERAGFSDMDTLDEDKDKYIMNNTAITVEDGSVTQIIKAPGNNENEARVIIKTLIDLTDKENKNTLKEVLKHFDDTVNGKEDMFYIQKEIGNKELLILFGQDDYISLTMR